MRRLPLSNKTRVVVLVLFILFYLRLQGHIGSQWQTSHGGSDWGISIKEEKTKRLSIAYLMMVHNEDTVLGATEFITAMNHTDDLFFIHADKNVQNSTYDEMKEYYSKYPNTHLCETRIQGQWARWSQIEVSLAVLRAAMNHTRRWDKAIFVDGSSYPLKKPSHWRDWISSLHYNASYAGPYNPICNFNASDPTKNKCWRTPARCLDLNCTKMSNSPWGAVIVPSVNWVMFPYEFGHHVLNLTVLDAWAKFLWPRPYPDEVFWSSVFWASPWKHWAIDNFHLFTHWNLPCRTYHNKRPSNSPCFLGLSDLDVLYASVHWIGRKISAHDPVKKYLDRFFENEDRALTAAEYVDLMNEEMKGSLQEWITHTDTNYFNFTDHHTMRPPTKTALLNPPAFFRLENQIVTMFLTTEEPFTKVLTAENRNQWLIQRNPDDTFTLRNRVTNTYLGCSSDEELVTTQTDPHDERQRWIITSIDFETPQRRSLGRFWTLKNVGSGRFLECTNCTNKFEPQVMGLSTEQKEAKQMWRILPVKAW
ncbi:hypothetical protein PROFUN_03073 [Planoprotostelium fungivorum]|uniref:protein xylosyltransferase n=1 Tax=Planoprotostelium fungivorum TaxID=1890364 RepID=A0A2P6NQ48_9EUKA|nr:hypothetical protein PROFUN_03073 [Planoprotostelium fungivorum]